MFSLNIPNLPNKGEIVIVSAIVITISENSHLIVIFMSSYILYAPLANSRGQNEGGYTRKVTHDMTITDTQSYCHLYLHENQWT